jgi:hypothetical protein
MLDTLKHGADEFCRVETKNSGDATHLSCTWCLVFCSLCFV